MSGPIPSPALLREYGEVIPGLDRKIVEWADTQHYHRLDLEGKSNDRAERRMDRAQTNFFIIAALGLLLAAAVGTWGNAYVAAVIALVSIGGPNAATILSRGLARGTPGEPSTPKLPSRGAKVAAPDQSDKPVRKSPPTKTAPPKKRTRRR